MSKKEFLSCAEDVVCQIDAVFSSVPKRAEHLVNIFHLVEEDRWFYYLNHDECDVDLLSAAYFSGDLTAIQVIANKVEI